MNETTLTWAVFILAFGGMVIIHELGHFIGARLVKVEVEEFGLGLPTPGAITLFTWQGTRFTLNWLPLGGFVRPKGENDSTVEGGFASAAPWKRLVVLAAGPLMNLITAVLLISLIINQVGGIITPGPETDGPVKILITEVVPDGPAKQAGILVGDIVLKANGQILNDSDEASALIKANPDTPIVFEILRGSEQLELTITPRMSEAAGRPLIGVSMCGGCEFQPVTGFFETLRYGAIMTGEQIYLLTTLPVQLITGEIPAEQGRLIGLKGIFDIMRRSISSDVESSQRNAASTSQPSPYAQPVQTLSLLVSLSISLGIFNLFPFPALDGGRILFVLAEMLFRRRVPQEFENVVHGVGMAFLLLVMVYVNVRDFIDPISSTFP